ncbi:phosphoenolpyruvate carboxykinase (GTP) [Candidatus Fervidibacteria bacterium JGI MDM2 SSWTFF-3-K9]
MAMLPFCGYNMADYFRHWLEMWQRIPNPPKIFFVNWFRKDENGNFLWPGFGENMRVLKWIVDRVKGKVDARETPIGLIPKFEDLELDGLNISSEQLEKLFAINPDEWQIEMADIRKFFEQFGERLPKELWEEFNALAKRLKLDM